jgi:hypothetical protein
MTAQAKLKKASALVEDVRTTLVGDDSAIGCLINYRLMEAGLQLQRAVRELSER